jgi:hypothetical protein
MNGVLHPFLRKFVLVFLYDILIYSPTLETHKNHLRQVLAKLREHQLCMKLRKCSFAKQELDYLDHIISDKGVATNPTKTTTMLQWPIPTNVTELRGGGGVGSYRLRQEVCERIWLYC